MSKADTIQFDNDVRTRAVHMALIHDMGEALIGDITPSDGISKGYSSLRIDRPKSDSN